MDIEEITELVSSWDGVLTLQPRPGDGSPEISWGDVFFYVAPDGAVPSGQPFATIVTKDYPDDRASQLDRPHAFRLNIAATKDLTYRLTSEHATADVPLDPSAGDVLRAHPVYADLGWVAVVNPAQRTRAQVLALLEAAHSAAHARRQRRRDVSDSSR